MREPVENNRKKYTFFKYHFPVVLYATAIIILSSLTFLKTAQIRFLAFDKIVHFFEYAIFAFLAVRSFTHLSEKITQRSAFLLTSLFIVIFAIFDEYFVQSLSRRTSSVYDLLADVIGAFLILIILWLYKQRTHKNRTK